jgi:hypothetical protein
MMQTLQASEISLRTLIDKFGLQYVQDPNFFPEWRQGQVEVADWERQSLERIQAGYLNLIEYPPLPERAIQISVVSPLLFSAGFYLPPFHIQVEKSVEIAEVDEEIIVRGQIDILLVKERFWVLVIESKRATFSIEAGLAQLLAYMLANPDPQKPGFGMITSGADFIFVKLQQVGNVPRYATSAQFGMRNQADLIEVLRILKRISQL